jgi:hypothetical protein
MNMKIHGVAAGCMLIGFRPHELRMEWAMPFY